MAVEDKYVDADLEAGKLASALFAGGQKLTIMKANVAVAAADDDGSVFRCFKTVPSSLVPLLAIVHNDANVGATDYDFGLYKTNKGAVVDVDALSATIDMSVARTKDTLNNIGLQTVALGSGADLGELSGQTEIDPHYDIAFTANTAGGAGTIEVTLICAYK